MDISKLLDELTLDEKCALTAGGDMWTTVAIERLGVPSIKMTDGPSGARGGALPFGQAGASVCVPCGSALGATWDPALVEQVAAVIGDQARSKSARVLLAPTVNLHRSPLGGRNFECYSEDPLLSGRLAAAFVRGVQGQSVMATPKHLVANDAEFERMTINALVDERALRELYLVPFELAVREGGALAVMAAYNRLNGTYCSESGWLLRQVLRVEWGFEGIVLTDWFAAGSTVGSARAGLDLEMPGPGRFFGPALADAVRAGQIDEPVVNEKVRRLLTVLERVGAFADPLQPEPERSVDVPEHRIVARRAAAAGMVLLRNDDVLPFDAATIRSMALIGPNADRVHIMGGGSASLTPHYRLSPLDAIRVRLDDRVQIIHQPGCVIDRHAPPISGNMLQAGMGSPGLAVEFHDNDRWKGPVVHRSIAESTRLLYLGSPAAGVPDSSFSLRARGVFIPTKTGTYTFTLVQCGRARLFVGTALVLDGFAEPPPPGSMFFGMGSEEMTGDVRLEADQPVELLIEYSSRDAPLLHGVQIGCRPPVADDLVERAVRAAADAEAVVLVVGTTEEWEAEGHDRHDMGLPGDQDALIERVLEVNPNTVVVVNTGCPVAMPWADRAPALLQTWLGGQEMGGALADVLFGDAEPGGRLPTTFPIAVEHNPSHGNFPGENGQVRYGEGLFIGYRWYEERRLPVQFPFGHGLSYTSFELGPPTLSTTHIPIEGVVQVHLMVTNTGSRAGSEVVQCYVHPCQSRLARPPKELRAFAKVYLGPGESRMVSLELEARAFAYWDPGDPHWHALQHRTSIAVPAAAGNARAERAPSGWYIDAGRHELHIGTSSAAIHHVVTLTCSHTIRIGP